MPVVELMTWNKVQKRWFKKYKGRKAPYSVSPKQLGTEATKEASRQAANEWWIKKQEELDNELGQAKRHLTHIIEHYQEAKERWRLFAKWNRKYGSAEVAQEADLVIEWLDEALKQNDPPFPLTKLKNDPLWKLKRDIIAEDEEFAFDLLWIDRFNTIKKEELSDKTTPKANTIRAHIDNYLEFRKAHFQARDKIHSFFSAKQWLEVFKFWVDPQAPIEALDEQLWEKYFIYLSGKVQKKVYSPTTAKNYFGAARSFVKNRFESRFIDLPRNLNSRQMSFQITNADPIIFTKEEVHQYLAKANSRQKLYILLMLNCGVILPT